MNSYSQSEGHVRQVGYEKVSRRLEQLQAEVADLSRVSLGSLRKARRDHVGIPNCFHFVDIIAVNRSIEDTDRQSKKTKTDSTIVLYRP